MPIQPRGKGFMVSVNRASALDGYNRIRKVAQTLEEAEALEVEISEAIEHYGKWPLEEGDRPLKVHASKGVFRTTIESAAKVNRAGTLREALRVAIETHWAGARYEGPAGYTGGVLVEFFEKRGKPDIDDLNSEDIDALIKDCRNRGLAPSTINKYLSALRVINEVALKRRPTLATIQLPIPHVQGKRLEKWWLRPDAHQKVVNALRDPIDGSLVTDPLFADLIDIIVYQGVRVEEAMRMSERMFFHLDTSKPWFNPSGTKTEDAQNAIPVYPQALEVIKEAIARQRHNGWSRMFPLTPRQVRDRWNDVREFLGAGDIPTATMKSLRRTFAWYANSRGMPTSTLQKVLRHKGIATTAGYLELIGDGELENSRKYFEVDSATLPKEATTVGSNVGAIIQAYAMTPGVRPEDVARFAKELMA